MAAVAGVLNPVDLRETLLFFCSQDQQVGLSRRQEDADEPGRPSNRAPQGPVENEPSLGHPLMGDTKSEAPRGVIKNPSSFGAVYYKKLVCVYGIRTDDKICLVSPAFVPLRGGPTTKFNCLAACGDGKKVGWIYYLANDPPTIKEYRLDPGASAVVESEPQEDTYLCAYYNSAESKRYCIFQGKNSLRIVDIQAGSEGSIKNTTDAKPKTPMAVCMANSKVYLYYSDDNNHLVRIIRTSSGWQSSTIIDDAPALADGTQMTVTTTTDGAYNMIFYVVMDGGEDFYKYMDPLDG